MRMMMQRDNTYDAAQSASYRRLQYISETIRHGRDSEWPQPTETRGLSLLPPDSVPLDFESIPISRQDPEG